MLREFTVLSDAASADALSDALLQAGALSVSIEDADAETAEEHALYGEPGGEPAHPAWQHSRLVVLLPADVDPERLIAQVVGSLGVASPGICGRRDVAETDWVQRTQAQFPPTRIGETLWIVPTWHEPPDASAINIRLDPGVAFGTGTHPTTRLCLSWLERNPPRAARVLDCGCGSGVLAIAAAKLGAREVVGMDIDVQALAAARANSQRNGVDAQYTDPDHLPPGQFDVVVANILANPLRVLAPMLTARVAPAGALVLSGVLQRQTDELITAYREADPAMPLRAWAVDDGWVCLVGHRVAASRNAC